MIRMLTLACLLAAAPFAVAGEEDAPAPAPGRAVVTRGDLEVVVDAEGTVEAAVLGAVVPAPKAWRGRLVVLEAAEPGSRVEKGEVVLRFDLRELEDAVDDARFDAGVLRGDGESLAERQRIATERAERDLDDHARAVARAEARLASFLEFERPQAEERRRLDDAAERQNLENARQELEQLVSMYEEDELVDATEKIVMARARWNVEYRAARHEHGKRARAHQVGYDEKNREEDLRRDVEAARRALEWLGAEQALAARSREVEAERARRRLERHLRNLERLEADLAGLVVRAPASGVLLHGPAEGGISRRFEPGATPNPLQPVVTVVDPGALHVVLRVPAREALRLAPGAPVTIEPDAEGAEAVPGVVEEVEPLPAGGKLEVRCRPERALPPALLGGAAKGAITVARAKDALLLPVEAVRREGGRTFVLTILGGGPPVQVDVKTGLDDGKRIVVEGLEEGQEVLLP